MTSHHYYHYYVEGQDEKKLIDTLKTRLRLIRAGKVQVFNVVQNKINQTRLMGLQRNTCVVLVFDTDHGTPSLLQENIRIIQKHQNVSNVICITQVRNLEDELIRSCQIRSIRELTGSKSDSNYKSDLIHCSNLDQRLKSVGFDIKLIWAKEPDGKFSGVRNEAIVIKV